MNWTQVSHFLSLSLTGKNDLTLAEDDANSTLLIVDSLMTASQCLVDNSNSLKNLHPTCEFKTRSPSSDSTKFSVGRPDYPWVFSLNRNYSVKL